MSSKITFVRHGETYWNQMHKMQGQVNIPLNENGVKQAEELAKSLRHEKYDICISSPFSRAYETAQIVCKEHGTKIIISNLLAEQAYGLEEGTDQSNFDNPESCLYNYIRDPEHYTPAIGGESFTALKERAHTFVDTVLSFAAEQHENILITAHGAIINAILSNLFDVPLKDFWSLLLPNCGAYPVAYENGIWLKRE